MIHEPDPNEPPPPETTSPETQSSQRETSGEDPTPWESSRRILRTKGWIFALAITLAGLALRISDKLFYWVNPDEGINLSIISHPTLAEGWQELTYNTHPPLISIVLWAMSCISFEPTWFRMMSLTCGTALIFGAFLAGRELGGSREEPSNGTGLVAAVLIAGSPWAIEQSQILRPYMLQLALISFALYFLGRWLRLRRSGLAGFSILMTLAIAAQFSSFFILAGCAVLLALMLLCGCVERTHIKKLVATFLVPTGMMTLLFFVHIQPYLMGNEIQTHAKATWLAPFFQTELGPLWINLLGLHVFLIGSGLSAGLLLAFLASLAVGGIAKSPLAVLCATMFGIAIAASMTGHYPFGGSRHSGYLLLFIGLAIGRGLSIVAERGFMPFVLSVAALAGLATQSPGLGVAFGKEHVPEFAPEFVLSGPDWKKSKPALEALCDSDKLVLMELQGYYIFYPELRKHWDGRPRLSEIGRRFRIGTSEFYINHQWMLTLDPWRIDGPDHVYRFLLDLHKRHPELRVKERKRVWLLLGGWGHELPMAIWGHANELRGFEKEFITEIHQYDGFFCCELDLPMLLDLYGRIDRARK